MNGKHDYERKAPKISGTIKVVSGTNCVQTFQVQQEKLSVCNWLPTDQNLDGFIVDFPTQITNMVPSQKYDIHVDLNDASYKPFSLWMEFLSDGRQDR